MTASKVVGVEGADVEGFCCCSDKVIMSQSEGTSGLNECVGKSWLTNPLRTIQDSGLFSNFNVVQL